MDGRERLLPPAGVCLFIRSYDGVRLLFLLLRFLVRVVSLPPRFPNFSIPFPDFSVLLVFFHSLVDGCSFDPVVPMV
jgi:hypothetical protein